MASFLRRPSNNPGGKDVKKNVVQRFGSDDPPAQAAKPVKKGSFISLLVGSNSNGGNGMYFDNGVDPLGRLSTESAPPPPPSPIVQQRPQVEAPKHWVEQLFPLTKLPEATPTPAAELVARIRYFLNQKDPSAVERSLHLALFAQQEGEAALNAKLFQRFGEGLPLRIPGQKAATRVDAPVPKTLRELLRAFLMEHDPGYLAIEGESALNDMMAQAAEYGIDSLEGELCRKYGFGLNGKKSEARMFLNPDSPSSPAMSRSRDNSSFDQMTRAARPAESDSPSPLSPITTGIKSPMNYGKTNPVGPPPTVARAKSEKPQTFVEIVTDEEEDFAPSTKPLTSPLSNSAQQKPRRHDFFDDKSLRADLKAFYAKHDKKKLEPQKFEPIVQWAYKIGPSELNRRFEEKYGESLNQFIDDMHAGRPGVAPGPKNVPVKTVEDLPHDANSACHDYHEASPGRSFGVCACGFSRVDHRNITSLLVPGNEEPHFNKAKPKVIISKNPVAPPQSSAPKASQKQNQPKMPVPQVSQNKVAPKVIAPPPKFEVKAEGMDGPCSEYRLDLEGRSFGVCKCGWSRPEHYKAKQQVAWATQGS